MADLGPPPALVVALRCPPIWERARYWAVATSERAGRLADSIVTAVRHQGHLCLPAAWRWARESSSAEQLIAAVADGPPCRRAQPGLWDLDQIFTGMELG